MEELEQLKRDLADILSCYRSSAEFVRFSSLIAAMEKDPEVMGIITKLNSLQALCRTKEGEILKKKEVLSEIERSKARLYSLPLWVNYRSAKEELERLRCEIVATLEKKLG